MNAAAKLLVVDDDPANRLLLTTILRHDGHEVFEAADGATALDVARREQPDLIILDLSMPVMNGPAFIKRLRAESALAHIGVALSTASTVDAAMRDFMQMTGIRGVIPKPCEPQEISRIVHSLLR